MSSCSAANRDYLTPIFDFANRKRHNKNQPTVKYCSRNQVSSFRASFPTMKPRPMFSTLTMPARSKIALTNLQCHRGMHIRATAPALRCKIWSDESQSSLYYGRIFLVQTRRHASSAAAAVAPAKRTGYSSPMPHVQSGKTRKTTVPTKTARNVQFNGM